MINDANQLKKIMLILVSLLIIGGLVYGGYQLFSSKKPIQETTPKTTQQESQDLQNKTIAFKQDSNFAVDRPFEKGKYKIEYEGINTTYYISFETAALTDYRNLKKEAEQEFKDRGVSDLCAIKMIFIVPKAVKDAQLADSLATGCKPF